MNNCVNRYKILAAWHQSTRTPCRNEDTLELKDAKGWGLGYIGVFGVALGIACVCLFVLRLAHPAF